MTPSPPTSRRARTPPGQGSSAIHVKSAWQEPFSRRGRALPGVEPGGDLEVGEGDGERGEGGDGEAGGGVDASGGGGGGGVGDGGVKGA